MGDDLLPMISTDIRSQRLFIVVGTSKNPSQPASIMVVVVTVSSMVARRMVVMMVFVSIASTCRGQDAESGSSEFNKLHGAL